MFVFIWIVCVDVIFYFICRIIIFVKFISSGIRICFYFFFFIVKDERKMENIYFFLFDLVIDECGCEG